MLVWIKRLFRTAEASRPSVQPLSFDYVSKEGGVSRVYLRNWVADHEYVVGEALSRNRQITYRLDRIALFHDTSYRQLKGYRPPKGSPLDPSRLP